MGSPAMLDALQVCIDGWSDGDICRDVRCGRWKVRRRYQVGVTHWHTVWVWHEHG